MGGNAFNDVIDNPLMVMVHTTNRWICTKLGCIVNPGNGDYEWVEQSKWWSSYGDSVESYEWYWDSSMVLSVNAQHDLGNAE